MSVRKRKPEWESRRFDYFMAHFGAHSPLATTTRAEIGKWRDERLKTVVGATVQREANLLRGSPVSDDGCGLKHAIASLNQTGMPGLTRQR